MIGTDPTTNTPVDWPRLPNGVPSSGAIIGSAGSGRTTALEAIVAGIPNLDTLWHLHELGHDPVDHADYATSGDAIEVAEALVQHRSTDDVEHPMVIAIDLPARLRESADRWATLVVRGALVGVSVIAITHRPLRVDFGGAFLRDVLMERAWLALTPVAAMERRLLDVPRSPFLYRPKEKGDGWLRTEGATRPVRITPADHRTHAHE